MTSKTIFLSYRRDDSPGYVSRLETDLENAFGAGRVFRDVEDIEGGSKWKDAIEDNLKRAAALILVIGPRWQEIWEARKNDPVNYVAFELQRARDHGVRIFPVTLNGSALTPDIDLGEINWLLDNQSYDISDKQGRWSSDVQGLILLLEGVDGLASDASPTDNRTTNEKRSSKLPWIIAAFIALACVFLFVDSDDPPIVTERPPAKVPSDRPISMDVPQVEPTSEPKASPRDPSGAKTSVPEAETPVPNITGTWQGLDGTYYIIKQFNNGTFSIESPDYTNGTGRFIENMPNKFEVNMQGVGRGEFAVSSDGRRSIGWIMVEGKQEYDTLTKLD